MRDQDFHKLKFCPVIHNDNIILVTLSSNRKEVKVDL